MLLEIKDLKVSKALDMENVSTLVLVEDAIDAQKGVVLARAFEPLTKAIVRTFEKHEITTLRVIDTSVDEGAIILSKALGDASLMGRQTRLYRNHVKLIFGA